MIFLYLAGVFISLFILYGVSRHDFVLLRQSISLRTVFDNAFITIFTFFFVSRIGFILTSGNYDLFNPLKILYLTRYWGILPFAGILATILSILILFRKKKNKLRILDIYFISFTPLIVLDVLLKSNSIVMLAIKLVSLLVLISFYGWFIKIHNRFSTKDGFITGMTVLTYSMVTLAFSIAQYGIYSTQFLAFNILLALSILSSSIFMFLVQKDIFNKQ